MQALSQMLDRLMPSGIQCRWASGPNAEWIVDIVYTYATLTSNGVGDRHLLRVIVTRPVVDQFAVATPIEKHLSERRIAAAVQAHVRDSMQDGRAVGQSADLLDVLMVEPDA